MDPSERHPRYLEAVLIYARSNSRLGWWAEARDWMKEAVAIARHLEPELTSWEEEEEKYKERQLQTVRMVLAKGRNRKGQSSVMRYPADFDTVRDRFSGRCS